MDWRIHHFEETTSTNLLAHDGAPGDVFTAAFQTGGRGRLDHRWLSPKGRNLMMSAVVDLGGLPAHEAATLPLAVGLAVADALRAFASPLAIKWPNDVLLGGRKLAGILCERNGDCGIAGIGVNVLQTRFPREIAARATSLALAARAGLCSPAAKLAEKGRTGAPAVDEVRDAVLAALSRTLAEWRAGGFAAIHPRIAALDALRGRVVRVRQDDSLDSPFISGICGGIAADGSLAVGDARAWAGEALAI